MIPVTFLVLGSYLGVIVYAMADLDGANNIASSPTPPPRPPPPRPPPILIPNTYSVDTGTGSDPKPKDYPYAPTKLRVNSLVEYFEAMRQNQFDPEVREKQSVVISLSEAASKLYLLSYGYSLEVKCNKYVKLIERPNIRSFVTVRELMNESRHFSEVEQRDANLLPRLVSERNFDALSKLQTIFQSLESEGIGGRSSFEPNVRKDLLHCMNYFIYRHQRATTGLVDYIRAAREKLNLSKADDIIYEAKLKKYSELMENIEKIEQVEREQSRQTGKWLHEFSKLYELALENHFELPKLVEEFATDPTRTKRLNLCFQAQSRAAELYAELQESESLAGYSQAVLEKSVDYRSSLLELYAIYLEHDEFLPREIGQFLNRSDRLQAIETMTSEKAGHSAGSEENTLNAVIGEAIENIPQEVEPARPEEVEHAEQPPVVEQPEQEPKPETEREVVPAKETSEEIEEPREPEIEHTGQQQVEPEEIELEAPKIDTKDDHSGSSDSDSYDDYQSVASDLSGEPAAPSETEEPAVSEPEYPSVTTRLSVLRRVETCSRLANDLQNDVRSFHRTELNAEHARNLAKRVKSFQLSGCMRKDAEYCADSCRSSQWASLSMSKKLLDWTANQMQNVHSLPTSEQEMLSEILVLLRSPQAVAVQ